MFRKVNRTDLRKKRHKRLRYRLAGTQERPRLNVFRSLKHISAQVIDDQEGNTLVSASTLDPELKTVLSKTGNREAARKVGELLAQRALERGITRVVFDRGGYLYHGRVKALAEGARESGLDF